MENKVSKQHLHTQSHNSMAHGGQKVTQAGVQSGRRDPSSALQREEVVTPTTWVDLCSLRWAVTKHSYCRVHSREVPEVVRSRQTGDRRVGARAREGTGGDRG